MNGQFAVLNPWAEADPVPLRGISTRLTDLKDSTIGLLCDTFKVASKPVLNTVAEKLERRYPSVKFSWYEFGDNVVVAETSDGDTFKKWVKEVDAVIAAVGD